MRYDPKTFNRDTEVRLRIAGIYYDETFLYSDLVKIIPAIPFKDSTFLTPRNFSTTVPTIFELLEVATEKPGTDKKNFTYVFERRGAKGLSITSLGVEHEQEVGPTLNRNHRAAGIYQLTEIAIPAGVVAWQYYVYRKGISWSQLNPGSLSGASPVINPGTSGFTAFDQFKLEPGDEVVWRQVAILRGPTLPPSPQPTLPPSQEPGEKVSHS